jgi:hypothetical protein
MDRDQDYDGNSKQFEAAVTRSFRFLEQEHKMRRMPVRLQDRNSPRDAFAVIRYEGPYAAIDVCWTFSTYAVTVIARVRDQAGRIASSNPAYYVYFEPFIDFVSNGAVKPVIPYPADYAINALPRVIDRRKLLLQEEFESTIDQLAERVKTYGTNILDGDNTRFVEFHKWLGWDTWKFEKQSK